jgi:hypothetical protein
MSPSGKRDFRSHFELGGDGCMREPERARGTPL